MKQRRKTITIILLLLALVTVVVAGYRYFKNRQDEKKTFTSKYVDLKDSKFGYLNVDNKKNKSIYNVDYQNDVEKLINSQKEQKSYDIDHPLFILNPYGTNHTALYVYFQTKGVYQVEYNIHVDDTAYSDYGNTLSNKGTKKEQEGTIIGLIRGKKNTVTITMKDSNGKQIAKKDYSITLPEIKTLAEPILNKTQVKNKEQLSNGLYMVLGYDFSDEGKQRSIYLYDNNGIMRAELPCRDGHPDYDLVFHKDKYFYASARDEYCLVNSLGKIEKIIKTPGYQVHHDITYVDDHTVAVLAIDDSKDSIEDIILTIDLKKGKVTNVLDFGTLMPDIKERATLPKGEKKLDWIHFNTIQVINGKDMILSSRELSSIIRVNDAYTKPTIAYIISEPKIWAGTKYEKLVYHKDGDFPSNTGQHCVTYQTDDSLKDGQYYLYFYNNNYGVSPTFTSFDWSQIPGVSLDKMQGTNSQYMKYLVDENKKTYTLVDNFNVPYSSVVSSVEHASNDNIVVCSGMNKTFGEYDANGNLLIEFSMNVKRLTYRTFKYSLQGFWF